MAAIRADNVRLVYPQRGAVRSVIALDGVSFTLATGDRLGLIGGNGAGKTTLLKLLHSVYRPTSGSLTIEGRVDALFNINLGFRREATGRRNILLRGLINGWSRETIGARTDAIIAFSGLGDFIEMPLKTYSQGMAARLAFAIATSFEPEILLMDEWVSAGDAAFQEKARARMETLTARAGIVVLASHNDAMIQRTCNKVLELSAGRVVGSARSEAAVVAR
jgi:ABC-type polysaccharide/polyol phosphate transport system ATPase subunit